MPWLKGKGKEYDAKRKIRELITNLQSQIEDNSTRMRILEKEKKKDQ